MGVWGNAMVIVPSTVKQEAQEARGVGGPGPPVDLSSATSVLQELGMPVASQHTAAAAGGGQGDLPGATRVLQRGIGPTMPALEAVAGATRVLQGGASAGDLPSATSTKQEEASVGAAASVDSHGQGDLPCATGVLQDEANVESAAFGDSQGPSCSL